MSRKKKEDEVERLERVIREQKAIIRSLMKQVKKLDRGYHKDRESKKPPREREEPKPEVERPLCPECNKGEVVERVILNRRWLECTHCERRTKTKTLPST